MSYTTESDLVVRSMTPERRAQCLDCEWTADQEQGDIVPRAAKEHVVVTGHPVTIRSIEVSTWRAS
jgi:hypothetical protein